MKRLLDSPDSIKNEENELRERLRGTAKKRAKVVVQYQVRFHQILLFTFFYSCREFYDKNPILILFQKLLEESLELLNKRNKVTLKYIQASSELIALDSETQQINDALKQAQSNFKDGNISIDDMFGNLE